MIENITIPAAFIGGLISFFSPCVVVLVPAFLSNLAGVSLTEVEKDESRYRRTVLFNTLLFIAGFTIVLDLGNIFFIYNNTNLRNFFWCQLLKNIQLFQIPYFIHLNDILPFEATFSTVSWDTFVTYFL